MNTEYKCFPLMQNPRKKQLPHYLFFMKYSPDQKFFQKEKHFESALACIIIFNDSREVKSDLIKGVAYAENHITASKRFHRSNKNLDKSLQSSDITNIIRKILRKKTSEGNQNIFRRNVWGKIYICLKTTGFFYNQNNLLNFQNKSKTAKKFGK